MARLNVGDVAPDFEALTDQNQSLRLSSLRGRKVVIYFYPKDDTPGCTTQACGFRDNFAAISEKNGVVLGISPDSVQSHVKFKNKFSLPFTLVADPDHKIAEAYGVWDKKSLYGKIVTGIVRSHFVIDEQGKIIDAKYKISPKDSVREAVELVGGSSTLD